MSRDAAGHGQWAAGVLAAVLLLFRLDGAPATPVGTVELPPELKARGARLLNTASPAARAWASQEAAVLARGAGEPDLNALRTSARNRFGSQLDRRPPPSPDRRSNVAGIDVEPLIGLVMMMCAQDGEKDLQQLSRELEALKQVKEKLKKLVDRSGNERTRNPHAKSSDPCQPPGCGISAAELTDLAALVRAAGAGWAAPGRTPVTLADAKAMEDALERESRSLEEISASKSLKLQKAIGRQSKLLEILSNVLKKMSTTQESIAQNLK